MLRTSSAAALTTAALFLGACSLINAPDEIRPGGEGGGGGTTTSTTTTTTGSACTDDKDCPTPEDQCKIARCDATNKCVEDQKANNSPCDDGLFCTDNDICVGGVCMSDEPHPCPPSTSCVIATCSEESDACEETPKPDGSLCDDNDVCTATSSCVGSVCVSGPSCESDECNDSVCDTTVGCIKTPKPMGTACGNTACSTGQCDNSGKCIIIPINQGGVCDDGLFCTTSDTCSDFGQCLGGVSPCTAPAQCVKATCNEVTDSCDLQAIAAGQLCDDQDACSADETCNNTAQCSGGQVPTVYFVDTFANLDAQGWVLDTEWQIGQTKESSGGNTCCGFTTDPGTDQTGDGQVAGVQLGGNATVTLPDPTHPFYYLTSPVINTQAAPGALFLTFYRWLNSDYPPFMTNVIDVSTDGGANWNTIWISAPNVPIGDSSWTFIAHDIAPYKSETMQFRFGFNIGQEGVYIIGSWNIDNVKVSNAACPN